MRFSALKKLLTNNDRFKPDDPDYRRVYLLNIMFLLFIFFVVLYLMLNLLKNCYAGAVINTAASVLCIAALIIFHKTNRLRFGAYALIGIVFFIVAVSVALAEPQSYVFVWVCIFPPLTFFLLGRKPALLVTGIMVGGVLAIILVRFDEWSAFEFTAKSLINLLGTVAALCLAVWVFELSRSEAVRDARQKNLELNEANKALQESREYLRLILDSTAEAIFGIDLENKCTFCNKLCLELLGYTEPSELIGKDIHELIHNRRKDETPLSKSDCGILRTPAEKAAAHSDSEVFWRSDGTSIDVEYYSYPQYKDGVLIGAVVTFSDNTQKKLHARQVEYYGTHDALTGLLNRRHFNLELHRADVESNLPISIIMADLNGLKLSNDVFGHEAGDELLIKAAGALRKSCRGEEVVARVGGDEFAILLKKTNHSDAQGIIARIKDVLSRENVDIIQCSLSLGCDTKISATEDISQTLKNAENEMYKDKTLNRSRVDADMLSMIIMSLYRKCPFEEQHSINVCDLCRTFGESLDMPDTEILQLARAGMFHDIGKICINEDLLNKSEALTEEDKITFMQHPVIGYRILNLFDNTLNLAEVAYSHHERWNGSGYPRALRGGEIPLAARIIAIAGRYDRYVNGYHDEAVSSERALELLAAQAGILYDPQLVQTFAAVIREALP